MRPQDRRQALTGAMGLLSGAAASTLAGQGNATVFRPLGLGDIPQNFRTTADVSNERRGLPQVSKLIDELRSQEIDEHDHYRALRMAPGAVARQSIGALKSVAEWRKHQMAHEIAMNHHRAAMSILERINELLSAPGDALKRQVIEAAGQVMDDVRKVVSE